MLMLSLSVLSLNTSVGKSKMLSRRQFIKLPLLLPFVDVAKSSQNSQTVEGLAFPVVFASQSRLNAKPGDTTDVDIISFKEDGLVTKLWRVFLPFIK